MKKQKNENNTRDLKELKKQYEKYSKKNKGYIEVHVLLATGEDGAIPHIKACNVSPLDVAKMIKTLEATARQLEDRFPLAGIAKNLYTTVLGGMQEDDLD